MSSVIITKSLNKFYFKRTYILSEIVWIGIICVRRVLNSFLEFPRLLGWFIGSPYPNSSSSLSSSLGTLVHILQVTCVGTGAKPMMLEKNN